MAPRAPTWLLLCLLLTGCPTEPGAPAPTPGLRRASGEAGSPSEVDAGPRPRLPNVELPAGPFVMGSEGASSGGQDVERPRAERVLERGCFLDVYEVTNEAYARFLASPAARTHSACHSEEPRGKDHTPGKPTPEERAWGAVADPFRDPGRGQHPVVCVDWYDAYAFAAWMGRRLPSEVEHERAARGTDGRRFPWGDAPPREGALVRANAYSPDGYPMTAPVGSFPAGVAPCGAHDLAGNVWEWSADAFLAYPGAPAGTEEDEGLQVIRGGGWTSASGLLLRGATRVGQPRTYRSAALGFRTVGDAHVALEEQ